jgi:outer membrane biosynthesis protein TonB
MRDERSSVAVALALGAVSVLAHVLAYVVLGTLPLVAVFEPRPTQQIAFVVEEPLAPPPPEPAPEPEPEQAPPEQPPLPAAPPPPRLSPRPATPRDAPPPPPDAPPPAPREETPVAFDNVTLTNDGPSSFSVPQSSGESREGPIGPPGTPTGRRVVGTATGALGGTGTGEAPPGPRFVPVSDLSRRPSPPGNLDALLERFYPRDERDQGVEGEATLRVVLGVDGRMVRSRVVTATRPSFGEACRRLLRETRWSTALDRDGQPVSTEIEFRCDFEVGY